MRSRRCFDCERRLTSKPAAVYGARMVQGERENYLLKLCSNCLLDTLSPLVKYSMTDDRFERCCDCHEVVDDRQSDMVYLSVYLPHRELEQFDLCLCDPHAERLWDWFSEKGQIPPSRSPGGSQGPATPQDEDWAKAW